LTIDPMAGSRIQRSTGPFATSPLDNGAGNAPAGRIRRSPVAAPAHLRSSTTDGVQRLASGKGDGGLPEGLKLGIESLSGESMDHVEVHYNSPRPALLGAHAYTRGAAIHVASGQAEHLPHEAWHAAQQARGLVRPTVHHDHNVAVNDDVGLETEADVMGRRAQEVGARLLSSRDLPERAGTSGRSKAANTPIANRGVAQLRAFSVRGAEHDTSLGLQALETRVLPTLLSPPIDGDGLGSLYTAVMADVDEQDDSTGMALLDRIEDAARAAIAEFLRDPLVARLKALGLLDNDQILFWLSADYAMRPPPENLAIGLIAEAMSAEAQLRKHGPRSAVVSGLKVRDVRSGYDVAEIDNLTVMKDPGGKLRPVEVVEAKAGAVKKGKMITQLSGKVKGLRLVAAGSARLMRGDEDVTDQYDLSDLSVETTSAMSDPSADTVLDRREIDRLYEAMGRLRPVGWTSLRALAI
jgi:hypothetical protein